MKDRFKHYPCPHYNLIGEIRTKKDNTIFPFVGVFLYA